MTTPHSNPSNPVLPLIPQPTTPAPGLGGHIGPECSDFVVEEIPAYALEGDGEHWFVQIRKAGLTTPEAVKRVARAAGIKERDVGVAGMKDKQAVTTQWLSLSTVNSNPPQQWELADGVSVVAITRHRNKLRTGHLRGNRFDIRLCELSPTSQADLDARVATLNEHGIPNYYGAQRFGFGLQNLAKALTWLHGQQEGAQRRGSRFTAKWMPSVIQSEIFNRYVERRVALGVNTLLQGEVVRLSGSSRHFEVENPAAELCRLLDKDIVLSGPIVGPKMRSASGQAAALELQATAELGLDEAMLHALGKAAPGSRRDVMLWPEDLSAQLLEDGSVRLRFSLPSGAYATQVVREFTHSPYGQERARYQTARDDGGSAEA